MGTRLAQVAGLAMPTISQRTGGYPVPWYAPACQPPNRIRAPSWVQPRSPALPARTCITINQYPLGVTGQPAGRLSCTWGRRRGSAYGRASQIGNRRLGHRDVPRVVARDIATQFPHPLGEGRERVEVHIEPEQIAVGAGGL